MRESYAIFPEWWLLRASERLDLSIAACLAAVLHYSALRVAQAASMLARWTVLEFARNVYGSVSSADPRLVEYSSALAALLMSIPFLWGHNDVLDVCAKAYPLKTWAGVSFLAGTAQLILANTGRYQARTIFAMAMLSHWCWLFTLIYVGIGPVLVHPFLAVLIFKIGIAILMLMRPSNHGTASAS